MALIGDNGYVAVSNIENTWGTAPTTEEDEMTKITSCSVEISKERRSSAALEGGRGVRGSVQTSTNYGGGLSIEFTPGAGLGVLLRAAMGDYIGEGSTQSASALSTTLASAVAAGATIIEFADETNAAVDEYVMLGAAGATNTEVVRLKTDEAPANTWTIYAPCINAHDSGAVAVEKIAPFTHRNTRSDDSDLPSFTLYKSFGNPDIVGAFGNDYAGCRVGSFTLNFSQGENLTAEFDITAANETARALGNLMTTAEQTAMRSTNNPFIFENGTVTNGLTSGGVKSGSITVNNNLQGNSYLGDSGDLSSLIAQRAEVTATFDINFEDSTYMTALTADTSFDVVLTFSGESASYELVIDIPEFVLNEAPHNLAEGILSVSLSGICEVDTGDGFDIRISVKDTRYSYPNEA